MLSGQLFRVMAGLVPAIHAFFVADATKTWMPATSAGMTMEWLNVLQ
jgi:hypothetical protein